MNEIFEYRVPIKRYLQLIIFFAIATIIFGFLIFVALIKAILIVDFQLPKEFIGFIVFFPFFLSCSMWLIFGYEKITIDNQTIELSKSNLIFTTKTKFPISEFQSIELIEKRFKTDKWIDTTRERLREKQRAIPFWIRMGRLKLKTKSKNQTFFNGLSNLEVSKVKEEIEKQILKRIKS